MATCVLREPDGVNWLNRCVLYWCPGCRERHLIRVRGPGVSPPSWTWNGNTEAPTFEPSVHYVGYCHHFVRNGKIEFRADSKHELAGKVVDLPHVDQDGYSV